MKRRCCVRAAAGRCGFAILRGMDETNDLYDDGAPRDGGASPCAGSPLDDGGIRSGFRSGDGGGIVRIEGIGEGLPEEGHVAPGAAPAAGAPSESASSAEPFERKLSRIKRELASVPALPGVYLWKDAQGQVIYVGKAKQIEKLCARADFIAKGAPSLPPIAFVGNAPVLFCEGMNAHVVSCVEEEGCRAVMPPLSTFALHALICAGEQGSFADELRDLRASVRKGEGSIARLFSSLTELRAFVEGAIPASLTYGSGWLLPALMMHMAGEGVFDVAYLSTFGCLSGHVVGKGALNIVRGHVPCMNVASLEFDQGTSVVNQINRLKLLVSTAKQRANGS